MELFGALCVLYCTVNYSVGQYAFKSYILKARSNTFFAIDHLKSHEDLNITPTWCAFQCIEVGGSCKAFTFVINQDTRLCVLHSRRAHTADSDLVEMDGSYYYDMESLVQEIPQKSKSCLVSSRPTTRIFTSSWTVPTTSKSVSTTVTSTEQTAVPTTVSPPESTQVPTTGQTTSHTSMSPTKPNTMSTRMRTTKLTTMQKEAQRTTPTKMHTTESTTMLSKRTTTMQVTMQATTAIKKVTTMQTTVETTNPRTVQTTSLKTTPKTMQTTTRTTIKTTFPTALLTAEPTSTQTTTDLSTTVPSTRSTTTQTITDLSTTVPSTESTTTQTTTDQPTTVPSTESTTMQTTDSTTTNVDSTLPAILYGDCYDILHTGGNNDSGVYTILLNDSTIIDVYCDMDTDGGGWTIIQRRQDGSVDFYTYWDDYVQGFGDLEGEFWLGNHAIYMLSFQDQVHLRFDLWDFNDTHNAAVYDNFRIGDEAAAFKLSLGTRLLGDAAGDSMAHHNGRKFSTRDQDNDNGGQFCAERYRGGWWYGSCMHANLNGIYLHSPDGPYPTGYAYGIAWLYWYGDPWYSLKATEMKIRKTALPL